MHAFKTLNHRTKRTFKLGPQFARLAGLLVKRVRGSTLILRIHRSLVAPRDEESYAKFLGSQLIIDKNQVKIVINIKNTKLFTVISLHSVGEFGNSTSRGGFSWTRVHELAAQWFLNKSSSNGANTGLDAHWFAINDGCDILQIRLESALFYAGCFNTNATKVLGFAATLENISRSCF